MPPPLLLSLLLSSHTLYVSFPRRCSFVISFPTFSSHSCVPARFFKNWFDTPFHHPSPPLSFYVFIFLRTFCLTSQTVALPACCGFWVRQRVFVLPSGSCRAAEGIWAKCLFPFSLLRHHWERHILCLCRAKDLHQGLPYFMVCSCMSVAVVGKEMMFGCYMATNSGSCLY